LTTTAAIFCVLRNIFQRFASSKTRSATSFRWRRTVSAENLPDCSGLQRFHRR
jgi:hypothetical protein